MKNETCENTIDTSHRIGQESILYSPVIVQHERDNVYLLIDPASPNWASTNMLGSAIIRRCDGRNTLHEVAEWANIEYGLPANSVMEFIEMSAQAGFISETPDLSPPYPGRSKVITPAALEELWIYTNNSCPLRCRPA